MQGVIRRAGIFLLAACAVLAAGSTAGSLVRAASRISGERFQAPQPAETPSPSFFLYLPLVARDRVEAAWVTVIEEGFETPPGDLWDFWDASGGTYCWGRRDCRPYMGSYSAWAVGGADEASLPCGSNYPDNADSWMAYGPFSLEDATAARLSFRLWLSVGSELGVDDFCMYASTDANFIDARGYCLTYQPDGWTPLTFDLDNDLTGANMLGQPQVWIGLRFRSDSAVHFPEGVYVDDVLIRKCVGGTCQPALNAASEPMASPARRSPAPLPAARSSEPRSSAR